MSNWKSELEAKHGVEIFLCGQNGELSDNDKAIIEEMVNDLAEVKDLPEKERAAHFIKNQIEKESKL